MLQTAYQAQLSQVNALYTQKEQELRHATLQRQKHLEHILRDCQSQLASKTQRLTVLEREHSLLQSETQDQKGILEQYETRFVQVKKHIEDINSAHAAKIQQTTRSNEELTRQVQKQEEALKQYEEGKQAIAQKLRDQ